MSMSITFTRSTVKYTYQQWVQLEGQQGSILGPNRNIPTLWYGLNIASAIHANNISTPLSIKYIPWSCSTGFKVVSSACIKAILRFSSGRFADHLQPQMCFKMVAEDWRSSKFKLENKALNEVLLVWLQWEFTYRNHTSRTSTQVNVALDLRLLV